MLRRLLRDEPNAATDDPDAMFRRVVEKSADVICRFSHDQFLYVSPSVTKMFGWNPQELVGNDGFWMIHEADRPIIAEARERLVSGLQEQAVLQVRTICSDGSLKWVETTCRIETIDDTSEVILVMRDISDRKRLEEELSALASQDGLTGLANRRAFDQALDRTWRQTLREGGEMALVLMDVDCFKQFNDRYGHQAGDDCLRAVADSIQALLNRSTDLACRYGGEELVVVLGGTGLEPALAIAEQMRAVVASLQIPHQSSSCADHLTISIGVAAAVARTGGSMNIPEGLLQAADHALYKAKNGGRNRVEHAILIASSNP
ncbi:sensor domain-containing diguanylate cyclase [Aureimonas sp. Leaf454]|uniref:sensor domain-containing diguanylate cyclase n=1 Tax=Aureimonas sp. Leaf454 TaxID=1736381 RepID=UPI0019109427|nr:sensor domain-containing diguanylate cyclase [Aureimonas sp. Leaf454]